MSIPIQKYDYAQFRSGSIDEFERLGHPGRFYKSTLISTTTVFTGSLGGASGVLTVSGASGTIYLSNGGTINAAHLAPGFIHELSVEKVESPSNVYVLFRNHLVR